MQADIAEAWKEAVKQLKAGMSAPISKAWFDNTSAVDMSNGVVFISAPNNFIKEWLETRHVDSIKETLSAILNEDVLVSFISKELEGVATSPRTKIQSKPPETEARGGAGLLNSKYTFEAFVIGSSNRFAHAAALAVAELPFKAYNPLFIYGGVGLGKTHLLQAVGNYVSQHNRELKIRYVSTEKFTNDFISSIGDRGKISGFQNKYRKVDVLMIDDIQFIAGKEATQEEFFHTFNNLYEANKQMVITSDRPPKDISTLEDRLRSRFECGLITDVQPPDLETKIAILKRKLSDNDVVSFEVLEFIASRVHSNIRELEGALTRVLAFSSFTKTPIDIKLAEEVLRNIFSNKESRPISIQAIQNEVCRFFGISKTELVGSRRSQPIVYPRQIAMYLSRELTDMSLPKIGEEFGGRDHTTVMHANLKIERLISERREIYNQIQELINKIKQRS
ncbi:MAG: chromosomal replication initiator protein DnaA [Actinomycetota bacterium]|nr:chromosomal replication initiator protein DnaA [Actinomycetota bacterium]